MSAAPFHHPPPAPPALPDLLVFYSFYLCHHLHSPSTPHIHPTPRTLEKPWQNSRGIGSTSRANSHTQKVRIFVPSRFVKHHYVPAGRLDVLLGPMPLTGRRTQSIPVHNLTWSKPTDGHTASTYSVSCSLPILSPTYLQDCDRSGL